MSTTVTDLIYVNAGRISGQRGSARAGHGEETACTKRAPIGALPTRVSYRVVSQWSGTT